MIVIPIHRPKKTLPLVPGALFAKMEYSLKLANASFEKSVRLAKTLAPILNDQSSNARHLETIESAAPVQEKVIAILMLGFPKNRMVLPALQKALLTGSPALKMAAAIAITQMRDGENNEILLDLLSEALKKEASSDVQKALRYAINVARKKPHSGAVTYALKNNSNHEKSSET